jgi:hypothetical protein
MQERDSLNLTEPKQRAFRPHKALLAIGAITAVMLLAEFEVLPIAALGLIAAILLVVMKCLDIEEAYEEVEWIICKKTPGREIPTGRDNAKTTA